jgi:hypothetical protein
LSIDIDARYFQYCQCQHFQPDAGNVDIDIPKDMWIDRHFWHHAGMVKILKDILKNMWINTSSIMIKMMTYKRHIKGHRDRHLQHHAVKIDILKDILKDI